MTTGGAPTGPTNIGTGGNGLTPFRDAGALLGAELSTADFGSEGIGALVALVSPDEDETSGTISLDGLAGALLRCHSRALPPEAPSSVVRTARAAAYVARAHGFACNARRKVSDAKRGTDGWEIVRGSHVDPNQGTADLGARISPIVATAREGVFAGEPSIVDELRDAYASAADVLTGADLAVWFTAKVQALGGIRALKRGTYYMTPDRALSMLRLAGAIKLATNGRFVVGALAFGNAIGNVQTVVSSLIYDTTAACADVDKALASGVGKRGIATAEAKCADLLARLARFESLLGVSFASTKTAVEAAQQATAAAMLAALAAEEAEANK
jgi:hypothetical protein